MASRFTFEAIGTSWAIYIPEDLSPEREKALLDAIRTRISDFDKAYSRFRDDSLVAEMSRKAGEYRLPDDALPMLSLYRELYDISGGLVTPLVGQTLSDAGYDAAYTLRPRADIARAKP
ncbi:MAG TPA: FAD:protein FMN transferase, partial [Thermodesulfobacteriota bacterium]|nr:FAD:protein FMN transferase [Thermodesulfobacteriota bacterium]